VQLASGAPTTADLKSTTLNLIINYRVHRVQALVLPLNAFDIVLGKPWLEDANPSIDWKANSINIHGQLIPQAFILSMSSDPPMSSDPIGEVRQEFADVFKTELPEELPPDRGRPHRINLVPGFKIPRPRTFKLSPLESKELQEQLDRLLRLGFIRPSSSPFGAPVFFADKPGGGLRLVCDWRELNDITVKNAFLVPDMEALTNQLSSSTIFTHLDVHSAYHQVLIAEEDRYKTAIRTPIGHFEWNVLGFGLTNAPAEFQSLMNHVLRDEIESKSVVVYFDDIIIHSNTLTEHTAVLRSVLSKLRAARLYLKPSKCIFATDTVRFVGNIVRGGTVSVDPERASAIASIPTPSSLREVRSFVGMCAHLCKFIKDFSIRAKPLTALTQASTPFRWGPEQQSAFDDLKRAISEPPVLHLPRPGLPYIIQTDASDSGIGAALLQDASGVRQPVAFFSKSFDSTQMNWPVHDREAFAIIASLQHWRHLILNGLPVTVETDHNPLTHLLSQKQLNKRQVRWTEVLAEFDIKIKYVRGPSNVVADCLSRASLNSVSTYSPPSPDLHSKFAKDTFFSRLLSRKRLPLPFVISEDRLLYGDRVCVPSSDVPAILQAAHSSPVSGHRGFKNTLQSLHSKFFWPRMREEVEQFVRSCPDCQRAKPRNFNSKQPLSPLPIPSSRWESIAMDFLTGFPSISGKDSLLVVVDRFSKRAHFIPVPVSITAESTAKVIIREVVRLHGVPKSIVSDRDPRFTSACWEHLWSSVGTNLLMSTSSHPQTDGITERTNRTILSMLRATLSSNPGNWLELVPLLEFAYNSAVHSSTGVSPFEADLGYLPPSPLAVASGTQQLQPEDLVSQLRTITKQVREHLSVAQDKAEQQYNKNTNVIQYHPGDMVLVDSDQLRLPSHKLRNPWSGPFKVLQVPHPNTVTLDLHEFPRIHPTINTKFIKSFTGSESTETSMPDHEPKSPPQSLIAQTPSVPAAPTAPAESRPKRTIYRPARFLN
jgi:hypothetical protein